jgi:hypothetical protein
MEAKKVMQQTADNLDDVKRSSSAPSSLTIESLICIQGGNCEIALENGNILLIRPQITKLHANVNTNEPQSGFAKVASLRNGRWPVLYYGSTENVCSSYP